MYDKVGGTAHSRYTDAGEDAAYGIHKCRTDCSIGCVDDAREKTDTSRKVIVALKNNILYDLVLAPNVEVELSIGRKWSLNTEYKCPWWLNSRHSFAISFSREVWKFVIGWATEICVTS